MLQLILVLTFFSILLLAISILQCTVGKQKAILRVKHYIADEEEMDNEAKKDQKKEYRRGFGIIARAVDNARAFDGYKKKVQQKLIRAHVMLKPEEYITVCIILLSLLFLLTLVVCKSLPLIASFLLAAAAGVVGWKLPGIILSSREKKRIKHLSDQLGDAIVLISNSLKAGYSFFQSVDTVAKEMTGPIAEEFTQLQKEINLGQTTERALENLVNRAPSDDLELLVTAVLIQRQVGGNLSEVLDNISTTIRDRVKLKGEVRTVTAQGRMSGLIISLLPIVLGVIIFCINPEYVGLLFKNRLGIAMLVFSVFMELLGIYFIRKIVKIEM